MKLSWDSLWTRYVFYLVLLLSVPSLAQPLSLPDPKFKAALIHVGVDQNGDGEISLSEAATVEKLELPKLGIETLAGIRSFRNLRYLEAAQNQLKEVDLSGLSRLEHVYLYKNDIKITNLQGCESLKVLDLWGNKELTQLSLGGLRTLERLELYSTGLRELQLKDLSNLKRVDASESNLRRVDLGNNPALRSLNLSRNFIDFIPLAAAPNLEEVNLYRNRIAYLDIRGMSELKEIQVDGNPLVIFKMGGNRNLKRTPSL